MSDWTQGWMNEWFYCPNCEGISKGYSAPEMPVGERCICGTEMEGFRLLKKENA